MLIYNVGGFISTVYIQNLCVYSKRKLLHHATLLYMNEKFVYTVRESTRFSEILLYGNRFAMDTVEKAAKKLLHMDIVWFIKENLTV